MFKRLVVPVVLVLTFAVSFFAMTALTDTLARLNGFYAPGIQDSQDISL